MIAIDREFAATLRHGVCLLVLAGMGSAAQTVDPEQVAAARHVRCSLLVGNRVSSAPDEDGARAELGTAHDFLIDGASQRVTHVIVGSGGVAGIGDTLRCFELAALSIDATSTSKPTLALGISASAFAAAPSIGARDLDPFRAEIIATQGHGDGKPPKRFTPRAPILLMSELSGLELMSTQDGRSLGEVRDAWLELGEGKVAYVTLGAGEREVPVPLQACSIVAVPRARALQLCIELGDTSLETAPFLSPADAVEAPLSSPAVAVELDDEAFRRRIAAHFSARLAQLSDPRTPRRTAR